MKNVIHLEGRKSPEEIYEELGRQGVPPDLITRIMIEVVLDNFKDGKIDLAKAADILSGLMGLELDGIEFERIKIPPTMGGQQAEA